MHEPPIVPNQAVRPDSLVIGNARYAAGGTMAASAADDSQPKPLLVVEWDDHPDLFPLIRQQLEQTNAATCAAHALQVSCPRLATRHYHPLALVVENGVDPIPA